MRCPHCGTATLDVGARFCSRCGKPLGAAEEPPFVPASPPVTLRCYRHPDQETLLTCGQCERPICARCVVHHPVGVRCPECARLRKVPTFEVSPVYYARAVGAASLIGVLGVVALWALTLVAGPLGIVAFYLRWLALGGLGYAVGAGVNWAVNRKRSRGLQWIAGGGVVVVFLAAATLFQGFALNDLFSLLALVVAVYVAVSQLRV